MPDPYFEPYSSWIQEHTVPAGTASFPIRIHYPTVSTASRELRPGTYPLIVFTHGNRHAAQYICPPDISRDYQRWRRLPCLRMQSSGVLPHSILLTTTEMCALPDPSSSNEYCTLCTSFRKCSTVVSSFCAYPHSFQPMPGIAARAAANTSAGVPGTTSSTLSPPYPSNELNTAYSLGRNTSLGKFAGSAWPASSL